MVVEYDVAPVRALARAYRRDGAIVVRNLLSPEDLARCRECYDWCVANPGPNATSLFRGTQNQTHVDNSNPGAVERLNALVRSLPITDMLADLWGSDRVWYYAEEVFGKEGGTPGRTLWHQDTSYLPWAGSHWANAWISFEAIPKRNALEIVGGSHLGPRFDGTTFKDASNPTDPLHGGDALRLPDIEAERKVDPAKYDILSWATDPGDVVFLHPASLHGGAPVDEGCPNRHTLVLRFFGDDSTFSALPQPSLAGYSAAGVLHVEHLGHLKQGDRYRAPFFLQLR
jgi:ectoine hydroxylase-related dioxygenase (phytanoyl-CoA dioxygenase family)